MTKVTRLWGRDGSNEFASCLLVELVNRQYMRGKQDRLASRTLDRMQRWPTQTLPLHAEAAAPAAPAAAACPYFRCLDLAGATNTSPAGWPWPEIFFNQFLFQIQSDPQAGTSGRDVSSSPSLRQLHFAALGAAFDCGSGSFVAVVREGWHQLRFTGCREAKSK